MLQDLDPKLIDALEELRREFDDKLTRQRQELERLVGAPSPPAEAEPTFTAEPGPLGVEPQPLTDLDPLEELKLAAAEIDRSKSQADVLDALIRGNARFSSRTAVFLLRNGRLHGWGGTGFGEADASLKDLELECPAGSPWTQIASADGGVCLSSGDCSVLLDRLGADDADFGVLIPFVLRRQVAAVIYSDRSGKGQPFNISGLQLLSFLAGQTVETLSLRERSATASLHLASAPAVETEAAAEDVAIEEPTAPVAEVEEPSVEAPEAEAELEPAGEPAEDEIPTAVEDLLETPPALPLPDRPVEEIAEQPEVETPMEPASTEAEADFPAVAEPEPEPAEPPLEEGTSPGLQAFDEEPPPAPADPPPLTSTQVQPPQDVEGPGWAFTTTRIPTSAGVEALHEEARRLARLLVTEIKLYNEELVEEGRQAGNVYSRLREDIERSRQIFDDRIDPEVRSEKDYFREALVRILAGGDPTVLGIRE